MPKHDLSQVPLPDHRFLDPRCPRCAVLLANDHAGRKGKVK